jgi:hypothetical protein
MSNLPPIDPSTGDVIEPAAPPRIYPVRSIPAPHWRAIQAIWFVAGVVDVLVGLRFLLELLGASTESPFVALLYAVTSSLVAPFRGIFPVTGQGSFVFEPASLVALLIYPLIARGAVSFIRIMARRRTAGL